MSTVDAELRGRRWNTLYFGLSAVLFAAALALHIPWYDAILLAAFQVEIGVRIAERVRARRSRLADD